MKQFIVPLLLVVLFSGCLKSDDLPFSKNPPALVLIHQSNWPVVVYPWTEPLVDSVYGTSQLLLRASLSAATPLDHDLTVSFEIDPAAALGINTAYNTAYEILPENSYDGELKLVIPAGKLDGEAVLTIHPENFDGLSNYILPLTISSVSDGFGIATNKRQVFYTLQGY